MHIKKYFFRNHSCPSQFGSEWR